MFDLDLDVDYESCTDDELVVGMDQLHAAEMVLRRERLRMARVYEKRGAHRRDGATCMASWMATRHGARKRTARDWARVARALEGLPALDARAAEGRVSWDNLSEVTKAAKPETDEEWAERAETNPASFVARQVALAKRRTAASEAEARRRRRLRMWWEPEGDLRLSGRLAPAEGAAFRKAVELEAQRIPDDPETGRPLPYDQRCADALVGLTRQRLAVERDPDRATVVVHVDGRLLCPAVSGDDGAAETATGSPDGMADITAGPNHGANIAAGPSGAAEIAGGPNGAAEISAGPVISSALAERLACDARWQYVAHGPGGVVGIGRTSRNIPPALAREVLRLYHHMCAFPACEIEQFLEIHHLRRWSEGGRTDLPNLAPFCWGHHGLFHEPGWHIERAPDGRLRFYRPDGTEVVHHPPPPLLPTIRQRLLGPRPPGPALPDASRRPADDALDHKEADPPEP